MHRLFLGLGFSLGGVGVAAGAMLAHALDGRISESNLQIFETAARYHLIHALALILIGLAAARWPIRSWNGPGWLMFTGTLIFSGSLYALALTDRAWLGAITPVGGVMLVLAWGWASWIAFTRTGPSDTALTRRVG